MEHAPVSTLVVITLLQLCRAQTPGSTPEWYAANDINDTSFSPKPITELFSTETSFSPVNPIVVLPPTTPSSPENRGVVSSPGPVPQYGDSPFPPNVIPLSSTEPPSSPPSSDVLSVSTPQAPSATSTPLQTSTQPNLPSSITQDFSTLPNQIPAQAPRNNIPQNIRQNQPPSARNTPAIQQGQPPNIQFLLPAQLGNGNFIQGQQIPPNGQPNYIVLYQQAPQNIQNVPSANPNPMSPQISAPLQASRRDPPPQQIPARPPNVVANRAFVQQPQMANQFIQQPNAIPPFNVPNFPSPQPNGQPINQLPSRPIQQQNTQPINQVPVNQTPNIQQPINRYPMNQPPTNLQGNNQMALPPYVPNGPVLPTRPRQRNRVNAGRLNNRGRNQIQAPNTFPCQGLNGTVATGVRPTTATNPQNNVITIRLTPSRAPQSSRAGLQVNAAPNVTRPNTARARQNSQVNLRNYERCLNSCRDKKDRICAAPERDIEINSENLKGFPSMCHMACHNTFKANPIYGKITNGRCGKLRTRIQTVDKSKVRRDELKKSQYTIISNVPGTVVELAP